MINTLNSLEMTVNKEGLNLMLTALNSLETAVNKRCIFGAGI